MAWFLISVFMYFRMHSMQYIHAKNNSKIKYGMFLLQNKDIKLAVYILSFYM